MRPVTRPAALLLGLTMATATAGCSGGSEPGAKPSSRTAPTTASAVPRLASAPMKVVVTRVSGKLPAKSRPALEAHIGKALSTYVDAAFLTGTYPRSDFGSSGRAFTSGAARDFRRDRRLLTNEQLGPTTESVRATRRTAYLSVLAPYQVAAGVTARVDLVFVVDRGNRPPQRVRLAGRLLLTRSTSDGGWSIFGYDLHRSDTPRNDSR